MQNLKSTVENIGELVDQKIFFKSKEIRKFNWIYSRSIRQNIFTEMKTNNWTILNINTDNVNLVIVYPHWSVEKIVPGKYTKIYHFSGGMKVSLNVNLLEEKVGEFNKFDLSCGAFAMVLSKNVDILEIQTHIDKRDEDFILSIKELEDNHYKMKNLEKKLKKD